MKRAETIQNELKELGLSHLASMPKTMPFAVPSQYFNELSNTLNFITAGNEAEETSFSFSKSMPFAGVPEGYFEGLSQQILAKAKNETEIVWPKENPYFVPKAYFENLPQNIIAAINKSENATKETPKRIPLYRTVQLAATMALIFFVGLGVFKMNEQKANTDIFQQISQAEIADYVNSNIDDFDTDLVLNGLAFNEINPDENIADDISNDEIKEYLSEEGLN